MDYSSEFATAYGLDSDGVRILEKVSLQEVETRGGGSSWGIPCREKTEAHPNIASDTAKADQDP